MEIGTHCTFTSCNRLDFLPFTCENCHQVFCKDHRTPDSHTCECSPSELQVDRKTYASSTHSQLLSFTCSLSSCKRRELVEVKCPGCDESFCLQHRHQEDHNCRALTKEGDRDKDKERMMTKLKASTPHQATTKSTVPNPRRGTRSESTRAKVAIMKLKMKAEGLESIPQSERVYYDVQFPHECGLPNKPMFFSKEWSVGRVVDFIAEKLKLRNENNKPGAQRLLLHSPNGEPFVMSRALHTLLDDAPSGGELILEYQVKS